MGMAVLLFLSPLENLHGCDVYIDVFEIPIFDSYNRCSYNKNQKERKHPCK